MIIHRIGAETYIFMLKDLTCVFDVFGDDTNKLSDSLFYKYNKN